MMKQSPMYREPTDKQRKDIEKARKMTRGGIEGQRDFMSKLSTTYAKGSRDDERMGRKMMERVPASVRRIEAEEGAPPMGPYKKGGKVSSYAHGGSVKGCGIAKRGLGRGTMR